MAVSSIKIFDKPSECKTNLLFTLDNQAASKSGIALPNICNAHNKLMTLKAMAIHCAVLLSLINNKTKAAKKGMSRNETNNMLA